MGQLGRLIEWGVDGSEGAGILKKPYHLHPTRAMCKPTLGGNWWALRPVEALDPQVREVHQRPQQQSLQRARA